MPHRLLLADDSLTIQKVVELTFSESEYELQAVGSGDKAVEALATFRPEIVLADVVMPGLSGYEVCEAVKKLPDGAFIPVVLLTGTFEPFDRARAERVGCDSIVTKPFDSHALASLVRDLLEKSRKARESAPTLEIPSAAASAAAVAPPQPSLAEAHSTLAVPTPPPPADFATAAYAPLRDEPAPPPAAPMTPPPVAPVAPVVPTAPEPPETAAEVEYATVAMRVPSSLFAKPDPEPSTLPPWAVPPPAVATPVLPPPTVAPAPVEAPRVAEVPTHEPEPAWVEEAAAASAAPAGEDAKDEAEVASTGFAFVETPAPPTQPAFTFLEEEEKKPPAIPPPPAEPDAEEEAPEVMRRDLDEDIAAFEKHTPNLTRANPWDAYESAPPPVAAPEVPSRGDLEELAARSELSSLIPATATPSVPASAESVSTVPSASVAPPAAPAPPAPAGPLSDEDVDRIAKRVAELLGDRVLRDLAWDVVPEMAERLIRARIKELEEA